MRDHDANRRSLNVAYGRWTYKSDMSYRRMTRLGPVINNMTVGLPPTVVHTHKQVNNAANNRPNKFCTLSIMHNWNAWLDVRHSPPVNAGIMWPPGYFHICQQSGTAQNAFITLSIHLIHESSKTRQPLPTSLCASWLRMPKWPFCEWTDIIWRCDVKPFVSPVMRSGQVKQVWADARINKR